MLAAAVGFVGVLFVVRPDGAHSSWLGPLLPLLLMSSALFGQVVWGETIGTMSLLGIALLVASAIAVAVRRQQQDGPLV